MLENLQHLGLPGSLGGLSRIHDSPDLKQNQLKSNAIPLGGGPAITAVLGENAQATVVSFASASGQLKSGKLRPLACFGASRSVQYPRVTTLKELGYNVEFYLWVGLFAPRGTPESIIAKLRTETKGAVATELFIQAMQNLSQQISYQNQSEFSAFFAEDRKRVEEAVRLIGKI